MSRRSPYSGVPPRRPARRLLPRLVVAAAVLASIVSAIPAAALVSEGGPAHRTRTLSFPRTLARSFPLDRAGAVSTPWPATHIGFSWRGDEGTGVRYRVHRVSGSVSRWLRAPE